MSEDHYIFQDPGRLYHRKVKSDSPEIFSGGCVFIDNYSRYMRIKHQVAINSTENSEAKITLDREAQSNRVMIKVYHTDNGIFNASDFMKKLFKKQQKIRFSGYGT